MAVLRRKFVGPVQSVGGFEVGPKGTPRTVIDENAILKVAGVKVGASGAEVEFIGTDGLLIQEGTPTETAALAASAVLTVATGKTLTFTAPAGASGNQLSVVMATAADDNLAVTKDDGTKTITVSVANATDTKNTAALIQAAVRALTTVGGVAVGTATVAANAAYTAAPVITATVVATPLAGGANAFDSTGTKGQIKFDATNLYVCIATNNWKKVALSEL